MIRKEKKPSYCDMDKLQGSVLYNLTTGHGGIFANRKTDNIIEFHRNTDKQSFVDFETNFQFLAFLSQIFSLKVSYWVIQYKRARQTIEACLALNFFIMIGASLWPAPVFSWENYRFLYNGRNILHSYAFIPLLPPHNPSLHSAKTAAP
jgi:hypothetical protein